jgi:hypothetical protein
MSDQPDAYYQEWAARLNVTPELVADAERITGKPIADMIAEDRDTTLRQIEEDAKLLGTAMARHGADDLFERAVTIEILEKGQR